MVDFLNKNRVKVSLIIIIIGFVIGYINFYFTKKTSNLFQWLDFVICLLLLLAANFYDLSEVDYYDEYSIFNLKPNKMTNENEHDFQNEEFEVPKLKTPSLSNNNDEAGTDDMPVIVPVTGYSLHNIHKKWRPMYMDICSFATNPEPQTEESIDLKLQAWGNKYEKVYGSEKLIAYVIFHGWGNLRIPEAGFFPIQ